MGVVAGVAAVAIVFYIYIYAASMYAPWPTTTRSARNHREERRFATAASETADRPSLRVLRTGRIRDATITTHKLSSIFSTANERTR